MIRGAAVWAAIARKRMRAAGVACAAVFAAAACQTVKQRQGPMPEATQEDVIREFRARVARGDTENLRVVLRVSGGAPAEQPVGEELTVSGRNDASVRTTGGAEAPRTATRSLQPAETAEVFREIAEVADELVPRSEARFIPDSTVGSVTIEVNGRETTLFFLVDEEQRQAQGKTVSPRAARALDNLSRLSRRLLQRQ